MKKLLLAVAISAIFGGCGKEHVGPVKDTGIYINEVQASGADWLELYNSTSDLVNLAGYKIYDDPTAKFTIGSGTLTANGFFILYCDGTGIGNNTNFKLSSQGETVYLENASGTLIDQVTFPTLSNGSSYARFPDGTSVWQITGAPTKNSTNGSAQAPTISTVNRSPLVPGLSDAVTVSAVVTDVNGLTSVKLFSRKDANAFSSISMTASSGVFSASIPAAASTGKIEYYIEAINTHSVTTNYPAGAPSIALAYLLNTDPLPALYINEFMAFNTTCCPDVENSTDEFDDWIEIYNDGPTAINIAGYYLSDDDSNPFKFFVESTDAAKTTIPSKGYLVIWADEQKSQGILHANFKLANAGEAVGLYYVDGRTIDQYTFGAQSENISWGRVSDAASTWTAWTNPTQGTKNQ